ncbi:MAG TPA: NUDIX domain-containing protein [Microthrixaceae bacterium]|nr:NUDIX domain-containing protein [Microthrixaceae bacterium]
MGDDGAGPRASAGAGDELVEEVDTDGRVLRVVTRAEMRAARLRHRTTFIAVVDADHRLLVHQRSPLKDVWPSRWDIAAGGVAAVGESWEDGARRELAEELGIDAAVVALGGGRYDDEDVKTVAEVFLARHAGAVRFADGEVVDARWVTLGELNELIRSENCCPDSIALVLPLVRSLLEAPTD